MLHGMINEQGQCPDVGDDFSETINVFRMFSYKSLASGA